MLLFYICELSQSKYKFILYPHPDNQIISQQDMMIILELYMSMQHHDYSVSKEVMKVDCNYFIQLIVDILHYFWCCLLDIDHCSQIRVFSVDAHSHSLLLSEQLHHVLSGWSLHSLLQQLRLNHFCWRSHQLHMLFLNSKLLQNCNSCNPRELNRFGY
jgi:hypothetical protein